MSSLFDTAETNLSREAPRPLADRLRPQALEEIVGQDHLVGEGGTLRRMVNGGALSSLILWGPPGCGKTTMARIIAKHTDLHFEQISAIFSGMLISKKFLKAQKCAARMAAAHCCSWMRSIASTNHSRMHFYP